MKAPNPFNPQLPCPPEDFVGRKELLKAFEERLESTLNDSPMSMAIIGNRGVGKTSLLSKYEAIAKKRNCLVVRLSPVEGIIKTLEDLCKYLLSTLEQEAQKENKFKRLKASLVNAIKSISLEFSTNVGTFRLENAPPSIQPSFRQALESFWLEAREDVPAILILVDEAEALPKELNSFMFLREIFQRLGEEKNRYMLILCGKVEFPEKLSGEFSPLLRFFHPEQLKPFSEEETREYIVSKLKRAEIEVREKVVARIYQETEGHPYVLAAAMYILYAELPDGVKTIEETHLDAIKPELHNFISKEFFYPFYYTTTPAARKILHKMSKIDAPELEFKDIVEHTEIKSTTLAPYLQELVRKGCIEKISRGKYRFFHRLFKEYVFDREDIGPKARPRIRKRKFADAKLTTFASSEQ